MAQKNSCESGSFFLLYFYQKINKNFLKRDRAASTEKTAERSEAVFSVSLSPKNRISTTRGAASLLLLLFVAYMFFDNPLKNNNITKLFPCRSAVAGADGERKMGEV